MDVKDDMDNQGKLSLKVYEYKKEWHELKWSALSSYLKNCYENFKKYLKMIFYDISSWSFTVSKNE